MEVAVLGSDLVSTEMEGREIVRVFESTLFAAGGPLEELLDKVAGDMIGQWRQGIGAFENIEVLSWLNPGTVRVRLTMRARIAPLIRSISHHL
ncbi:hypothetical protein [Micromonospora rosaria]|nr:hypothetical protein [Micromonospora rosaria]